MGWTPKDAVNIATLIHKKHGSENFVFCFDSSSDKPKVVWSDAVREGKAPHSSIVDALQHVYQGKDARINGLKLYFAGSFPVTAMCTGMRRFLNHEPTFIVFNTDPLDEARFAELANSYPLEKAEPRTDGLDKYVGFEVGPTPAVNLRVERRDIYHVHKLYMMTAFAITEARARALAEERNTRIVTRPGYNIGAILVGPDGNVLGWGRNEISSNYTFHAEVNAVQSYYHRTREAIPDDSRLYTTLKPCGMCAGMLNVCTETDGKIRVFYGQFDAGAHATNTALDFPSGKILQLGRGNTKPLKTCSPDSYVKALDLAATLNEAARKTNNSLTQFLQTDLSINMMTDARRALLRKGLKYAQATQLRIKQLNVLRVLHQLKPFLVSCGITEWEELALASLGEHALQEQLTDESLIEFLLQGLEEEERNLADKREREPPDPSDPRDKGKQKGTEPRPKRGCIGN